jgi:hypothetical protein
MEDIILKECEGEERTLEKNRVVSPIQKAIKQTIVGTLQQQQPIRPSSN